MQADLALLNTNMDEISEAEIVTFNRNQTITAAPSFDEKQPVRDVYMAWDLEVTDINEPSQVFSVDVWLNAYWFDEDLPKRVDLNSKKGWTIEDDGASLPINLKVLFDNGISCKQVSPPKFHFNSANKLVSMQYHATAQLSEFLELQTFPFDRQLLNLQFNARLKKGWRLLSKIPDYVPRAYGNEYVCVYRFSPSLSGWRALSPFVNYRTQPDGEIRPTICLRVERRSSFYIYNVVLPLCFMLALSVASFALLPEQLSDRLNVTLTLLLTVVAFKFAVSSNLPTTSYLTLLDKYFVLCFFVLMLVVIEHTISYFLEDDRARQLDRFSALTLGVLWALFHVFIIYGHTTHSFRVDWMKLTNEQWSQPFKTRYKVLPEHMFTDDNKGMDTMQLFQEFRSSTVVN